MANALCRVITEIRLDARLGHRALDYDNDGWIDLIAVGETASDGRIVLLETKDPRAFATYQPKSA